MRVTILLQETEVNGRSAAGERRFLGQPLVQPGDTFRKAFEAEIDSDDVYEAAEIAYQISNGVHEQSGAYYAAGPNRSTMVGDLFYIETPQVQEEGLRATFALSVAPTGFHLVGRMMARGLLRIAEQSQ